MNKDASKIPFHYLNWKKIVDLSIQLQKYQKSNIKNNTVTKLIEYAFEF